jgi:hypothetical protein
MAIDWTKKEPPATFTIENEDDAWDVIFHLKIAFGWQVSVYDRSDVDDWMNRPCTDDEWYTISTSKPWRENAIIDLAPEHRYEAMCDLMNDLGISQEAQ